MILAEQSREELRVLNENLLTTNEDLQNKYNRILEMYTQSVIELERKDKQSQNIHPDKDRDKTVEKDKRYIGLARNGDFVSLRTRMF